MIEMGTTVRDVVTGFTGQVIARAEYQYETPQVLVAAETKQADSDARWFAEARVEVTEAKAPGFS